MTGDGAQPFHAHVYFDPAERAAAEALHAKLGQRRDVVSFLGRMVDCPVGPHPIPQFEVHFLDRDLPTMLPLLEQSHLRALVHPLTDDDRADHTALARWIGEPVDLDVTTLDPPGENKGLARFGISDF